MGVVTKHKALFLKEYGKPLVAEEVPTPKPKGEEVLLKTIGAGICHSDIHIWKGEAGAPFQLPMILGHEVVGAVVAKGDKVPESIKDGEAAIFYYAVFTEEDKYSRRGLTQHARTMRHRFGALQEYFLVPHYRFLVSVDGLEDIPASAPLGCAALTAYGAVKKIRYVVEPDEYVAIIGLGGLGLFALQWVKIFIPQANIIGIDIREDALEFANNIAKKNNVIFINASKEEPVETIKNVTHGEGVKAIIDFVGSTQTVATYIKTISPLGTYVLVGLLGARGLKLPSPFILMDTECIIQGNSMGSLPDLYEIVEFARKKRLDYRTIVTKRYNFDAEQVNKAFKEFDENKITGRQIITFN